VTAPLTCPHCDAPLPWPAPAPGEQTYPWTDTCPECGAQVRVWLDSATVSPLLFGVPGVPE